jgi:hypothetical protein
MRRSLVAALAAAVPALAPPGAPAQETLTPDGPATLHGQWLGAVTHEGRHDTIVVKFRVTVGPGGKAGRVRFRVLHQGDTGTAIEAGRWEWLPSEPGTYEFAGTHTAYDYRDFGMAIDQEVGAHAIVHTHPDDPSRGRYANPAELYAYDVFRPPLADDAKTVPYSERRKAQQLLVSPVLEGDADDDRLGDKTEDVGDLTVLRAQVRGRTERGSQLVVARVRNAGSTVRHLPRVAIPDGMYADGCPPGFGQPARFTFTCSGRALQPGEQGDVAVYLGSFGGVELPRRIEVAAEGPDLNPSDNAIELTPNLLLTAAARRPVRRGVEVTLGSDQPGDALIAVRVGGLRIARTLHFGVAGVHKLRFAPRTRAQRRRLARALRRRGRVTAQVTAAMPPGAYASTRVVLRRPR